MRKSLFVLFLFLSCLSVKAQTYYGFTSLTLDDSFVYRYVQAMDNESQKAIEELLAGKRETEDKSIIKKDEGEWYVKKDRQLPEGHYYESAFYRNDNGQVNIILPRITVIMRSGYKIDELLEYLGDKVTLGSGKNTNGNTYYFDCQSKTSEEVLEICLLIYYCGYDYGILGVSRFFPDRYLLDPSSDGYLIKELTGSVQPFVPKHEGEKLIYEMDWAGVDIIVFDAQEGLWEGTPEGIAINNISEQEWADFMTIVNDSRDIILEKDHNYIVRAKVKVPSDGIYQVNLFSWQCPQYDTFSYQVPVTVSDDFQEIDFEFPNYGYNEEHAAIFFLCGSVAGTTIINKVQVIEQTKGGLSAMKPTKFTKADGTLYNLAGQKVDASYQGLVIKNGQKFIQKIRK